MNFEQQGYEISEDKRKIDLSVVHDYLSTSTWAAGITRERVELAIQKSNCFGVYYRGRQIGFARLITDDATFGYLCDVFILPAYQGHGLGKWLIQTILAGSKTQQLRRILLATTTAAWLYQGTGFSAVNQPDYIWQIFRPSIYDTPAINDRP